MEKAYQEIAGYTYATEEVAPSPLSLSELDLIKKSLLWEEGDSEALRKVGEALSGQLDQLLDVWYGFVGSNPHLLHYFTDPETGQPVGEYLDRVRARFGQWVLDTCFRPYDQDWLNYQHEIGLRHHRQKKNRTDGVRAVEHVPLRYLLALVYPIYATVRPFLEKAGLQGQELERCHQAWLKAVLLQAILWSYPYVREGDF